jgi:hypothetical protein
MKPYGTAISTAVLEKDQGAGDSTPSNNDIQNGTEVPAPITNENYTSARLKDIYLNQRQNSIKSSL